MCLIWEAHAGDRPNLILIMADDLGYEALGSNGGTTYQTPQLDQLASKGMRFTHCYSQPVCTPSRVKIMTGQSNARNYRAFGLLPAGELTFGNLLKDAGYQTCIAGKWQLS
jgi:arylsulfatase A